MAVFLACLHFTESDLEPLRVTLRVQQEIACDLLQRGLPAAIAWGSAARRRSRRAVFVFNRKSAVSGAQESGTFWEVLDKTVAEWRKENPETTLRVINGQSCTPDGDCK